MHVLIYEYLCGAASADGPAAGSLRTEGAAMLSAVAADFARLPGVMAEVLLGRGCELALPGCAARRIGPGEEEAALRERAAAADWTLLIAPETDGLLATRCRWVEEAGGRLLGPSSQVVELTGDKLCLGKWWQQRGVPTPACAEWTQESQAQPPWPYPVIVKPRFGAGSKATFLLRDAGDLCVCRQQLLAEGWAGDLIAQPFLPGEAASVAFLIGPCESIALPPATQRLSTDGRFRYQGGSVPLPAALAERAERIARQAVEALPGLRGWVGVDVVLGEGGRDWAVEVNPRLTTSYVGLRALAERNLADALLRIGEGMEGPCLAWRSGSVEFSAAGA
ncbi:MAG TPA: ATP-grasp domain-containing protein [Gemmataceae bacterium]|nr:ATP-grasp domain-containing protein [Gemmataceae bacterium]